jgi:hypothetical protein
MVAQVEEPIPPGWKLWLAPRVPQALTQFAMAVRDHINDYPYGTIAETTTDDLGRTIGAFKSHHTWSFLKQADGSRKLVTGLWIPGVSLVIQDPTPASPGFGLGTIIPSTYNVPRPHPDAARFPVFQGEIAREAIFEYGKYALGATAVALIAATSGASIIGSLTAGVGGVMLFSWLRSRRIGNVNAMGERLLASGESEERILRLAALDLARHLHAVGPSQNSERVVWYFQQSWNAAQVGPPLNMDGKYTQDVNQALSLALQNYGMSPTVPMAIL